MLPDPVAAPSTRAGFGATPLGLVFRPVEVETIFGLSVPRLPITGLATHRACTCTAAKRGASWLCLAPGGFLAAG